MNNDAGVSINLNVFFGNNIYCLWGRTRNGVNGLFDMGANVWEWASLGDGQQQATLGGSWWYGARQMQADYGATKPRDMAAVYIGFRCITAP